MLPLNNDFRSLPEVFRSIKIPAKGSYLSRFLAFAGPGYLISVGYMDPGNWGTDLAGGSKFGYSLLWVILLSNIMAQFLQILCVRLGLVTRKDLAMACRDYYPKPIAIFLWIMCEIAIIACDLAEVIGSAVALNLLFGIRLEIGILITGADVFLLLGLMKFGFRRIEALVLTLVSIIFICFVFEIIFASPQWNLILNGMVTPTIQNKEALLIALGILGATVMPHNLYLHSSVVQTRNTGDSIDELKDAIHYNTLDTIIALSLAFLVNAAILIMSAAVFWRSATVVEELGQGHELLNIAIGGSSATLFAVALLASGQSSTMTGTLAGQVVMEGFLKIRLKPWIRRLITRALAIIPAIILIHQSSGKDTVFLLILSQVVLSMQLPFAIFPLIQFTSDPKRMGQFANGTVVKSIGYLICFVITALNLYLLYTTL